MSGFSISGLGSGVDWGNYVAAYRQQAESAIARTLVTRQQKLASQQQVMAQVKGRVDALQAVVNGFKTANDFKTKNVSFSDSTYLSGTANADALNGSITVRIDQLATNEQWVGSHESVDASVTSTDQTFSITVRGTTTDITVASGTTLKELAEEINSRNLGITAKVYNTGAGGATPARIAFTDNIAGKHNADQTPGTNFNITINSSLTELVTGDFGGAPVIEGKDAKIYLNQSPSTTPTDPIYRETNALTDVLPGVTLNLKAISLSSPAASSDWKTITVSEDTSRASSKVKDFITKFNELLALLKAAVRFSPELEQQVNPTAGDPTLRGAMAQIQSSISGSVSTLPQDKTIRALSDLGVTTIFNKDDSDQNGLLQFDETKFAEKLSSDFEGVVGFFKGFTIDEAEFAGFGDKISDVLDSITKPGTGSIPEKITSLANEGRRIDSEIELKLQRINEKEQRLRDRFARLEAQIAKINSQGSSLSSALNALNLNNQAIARR